MIKFRVSNIMVGSQILVRILFFGRIREEHPYKIAKVKDKIKNRIRIQVV